MVELGMNTLVSVSEGKISSSVAGEVVILDLDKCEYFGFNPVGATVWGLLQQPETVESIHQALVAEYDVDGEQCKKDLLRLLQDLMKHGLVQISNEACN